MSNSIVGHNCGPVIFTTEWEVEIDDDTEEMEGELVDEQDILGYRALCPKNSASNSVTIYFYYYAPVSEWFWDYTYGIDYKPAIPVVFSCDSDWRLRECLNASFSETNFDGRPNGWIALPVTLKRKLNKDERIFFGVYSDILGYVGDYIDDPDTTMCYLYWSNAHRRDYDSQSAYVSSAEWLLKQERVFADYEICIYMQYENEVESVAYTRTVLGNVRAASSNYRRLEWKRLISGLWNLSSRNNRETVWKRNAASKEVITTGTLTSNHLFRSASDSQSFSDSSDKRLFFYRSLVNQEEITAKNFRSHRMRIKESDGFSFTDYLQQLLLIIRSAFSCGAALDSLSHLADYKRRPESVIDDEENIIRFGDNFRGFRDEIDFEARPFASRIFYRAVQTVMNFWDWLRGKIREANNVVTLFCPIVTVIELESRI